MKQFDVNLKLTPIKNSMYTTVAPLNVEAWVTPEPVPYEERQSGVHKKLAIGERWGKKIFDCGWFHFTGAVPAGYRKADLVVRIDVNGELCLVNDKGNPVRGLTARATAAPEINLGGPLKSIYELPAKMVRSGKISLWGDAGLNDLFGTLPADGSLRMAEIAVVNHERRALFYDLEVIGSFLTSVDDPENPRYRRYRRVFEEASAETDTKKARAICRTVLDEKGGDELLTITAVGHSHLDLAWLWPIRETIRKAARTFATALYNIERYPDYVFGASQPQQFAWLKEFYPDLYKRVKQAVADGRIEAQGCMWVEADMNVSGGEALVRQIIYGQRFFREEFGVEPDHLWLPDVFGYNAQLPQILKAAGVNYFMTQKLSWNMINRFPHHSFRWRGLDGSEVLAHTPPENTYNSFATLHSLQKIQTEYRQLDVSSHALLLYGVGDGGGGPDAEHLERLAREKNLPGFPRVKLQGAAAFFESWSKEAGRFPVWQGELYLERHQGTFTTQALTKQNNRRCELLLRELEWASVLAEKLCGTACPDLQKIWQEVLLYQFHDILPGSSIMRVYDEANARYAELIDQLDEMLRERYQQLADRLASAPGELAVFNSLPWPRSEWVLHGNRWVKADVPAMGYTVIRSTEQSAIAAPHADENVLENEFVRVRFAKDGTIRSLYNKQLGREMILKGGAANQFAVYADNGNVWDIQPDYRATAPVRPELVKVTVETDGPRAIRRHTFRAGASTIVQRIILTEGSPLVEFDTELDWHDTQTMLRVEFPVDVLSDTARYEIQFGVLERPAHDNTTWDSAKDEVPHQQWMDLSQADCGVAILNDCKYGARIKDRLMELTLLRCVATPNGPHATIGTAPAREGGEIYTDLGAHRFRYAVYAHGGDANLVPPARGFNIPLYACQAVAPKPNGETSASWLQLDDARVDIAAVKKAEDGRGWIVRLLMTADADISVRLSSALPFTVAEETDLMERPLRTLRVSKNSVSVKLRSYEIKTLRLV